MILFFIVIAIILSTVLGGLAAIKLKDHLHLILGFSAGTVLGVALFDLLPESFDLASKTHNTNIITIMIAVGFCTYMIIDRSFSLHVHTEEHCDNPSHSHSGHGFGASALIVHSFLDGLGIGLAFKVSPIIGWVVAAGVLTHKFSDGISTVSIIMNNKNDKAQALKWLVAAAVAPTLGVAASYLFSVTGANLGLILSFFVGLFLYLSASDLIPESHHKHPTIWTTIMTVIGISVIYLTNLIIG